MTEMFRGMEPDSFTNIFTSVSKAIRGGNNEELPVESTVAIVNVSLLLHSAKISQATEMKTGPSRGALFEPIGSNIWLSGY